jgi:triosephosphate isomerase
MKSRLFVAGNWKMNLDKNQALQLVREIEKNKEAFENVDVAIFPPFTLLSAVNDLLTGEVCHLGGQNCHDELVGAHTGEISASMLRDVGCDYVILGHSERRANQLETNEQVKKKVAIAAESNLTSIICVGETLDERNLGQALSVVEKQLIGSIPVDVDYNKLIVAYEPVGAIGTGKTATINDIAEIHAHIRIILSGLSLKGDNICILYGGSVKPVNAADIFQITDVGGALVGGASLLSRDFISILHAGAAIK